jgi:hypothetical protein
MVDDRAERLETFIRSQASYPMLKKAPCNFEPLFELHAWSLFLVNVWQLL